MAETTSPAGETAAVGTTTPGSTPAQAPAEAGKTDGVEYWKAEAKKAFDKRDKALEEFKGSDEFRALLDRATKAEQYEKAQAEAERKAAEERGEFKRLYEERNAELDRVKADYEARVKAANDAHLELARKHKSERARAALSEAYQAAGGIDLDAFLTLASPHLNDGTIAVGDDGTVNGHGDVVKRFVEKRGYLFRTPGVDALRMLERHGVRVEEGPATFAERDAKANPPKQVSLAEFSRAQAQQRAGLPKTRYELAGKSGG